MEVKNRSGRIYLFDNLKFFLITAVVIGHFADEAPGSSYFYKSIFLFLYAFHMPLFLFCSGLFHSNKDVFIRAFRFVSVGFATKIIFTLVEIFLGGKAEFSLLKDDFIPWYMFVMAIYQLVTYALRKVDKKYLLVFSVLLALFVGYDKSVGDFLYLSRAIVFYPFYLCGQLITKKDILKINRSKPLKIIGAVIIAVWLILCFTKTDLLIQLRPLLTGRNSYMTSELFVRWGFFYRGLCYLITLLLSFSVICLMPSQRLPVITDFGSRTMQVYLWHWPVIRVLRAIGVEGFLIGSAAGKIAWLLIGVAVTFVLCAKPFSFPTKQIFTYCRHNPKPDAATKK